MAQNNSHQGLYNESKSKWILHYDPSNDTTTIGHYNPSVAGAINLYNSVCLQNGTNYCASSTYMTLYPCFGKTDASKNYYFAFQCYVNGNVGYQKIWGSQHNNLIFEGVCQAYSSRYVKHNIQPLTFTSDIIDRLNPVSFIYNNDTSNKQHLGLIYEDTVNIVPQICLDDGQTKTINYAELTPLLLKEIQNLRKRVKTLEEQLSQN